MRLSHLVLKLLDSRVLELHDHSAADTDEVVVVMRRAHFGLEEGHSSTEATLSRQARRDQ